YLYCSSHYLSGEFFFYVLAPSSTFRLSVVLLNQNVLENSSLELVTSVFGSSTKTVVVAHELMDAQNKTVLSFSQQVVPGKSVRLTRSLLAQPGQYALVSTMEDARVVQFLKISSIARFPSFCSNGVQDQSEIGIDCGSPCSDCVQLFDTCTDSCDDDDSCTEDSCVTGACVHKKIDSCCGDFTCSYEETAISCPKDCAFQTIQKPIHETIASAVQQAKQDVRKGIQICSRLSDKNDADQCLASVAVQIKSSLACEEIAEVSVRDVCYLDYAQLSNDYSVCDKVNNRLFKSSCFSFRNSVIN
ncbi:MAG: hypothetical protein Q7K43_06740, partial [Candidatus Woesearchaeota archaeon]|nr:hypothetical protein [Candidatus Woesearchaeota archaeon]